VHCKNDMSAAHEGHEAQDAVPICEIDFLAGKQHRADESSLVATLNRWQSESARESLRKTPVHGRCGGGAWVRRRDHKSSRGYA